MRPLPLLTTGLLAATLLAAPGASAVGETCRGRTATVVGLSGQALAGTEGDDVVVTNGATSVSAAEGNDLVCVTGFQGSSTVGLDAGPGDDVVDASAATGTVIAQLGSGSDSYTGSPSPDSVYAGTADVHGGVDQERDSISTGTGVADFVSSGTYGSSDPNSDVVAIGGRGEVMWWGPMTPIGHLDGGTGGSTLTTGLDDRGPRDVVVDAAAGAMLKDGLWVLSWTGFDRFDLRAQTAPTSFVFAGTDRREAVVLRAPAGTDLRRIDLGGGDDSLEMTSLGGRASRYDGGAGADDVTVSAGRLLDLDLATGRTRHRFGGAILRSRSTGFEGAFASARTVSLRGTGRANALRVYACSATVRGRGGADDIRFGSWGYFRPLGCGSRATFYGDGGRDVLLGSPGNDLLVGGPGRDTVAGKQGRDTCSGERLTTCEIKLP